MSDSRRGRRKSKASHTDSPSTPTSETTDGYLPPAMDATAFVTQPPKQSKGLTGKISTLFRREASRERNNDGKRGYRTRVGAPAARGRDAHTGSPNSATSGASSSQAALNDEDDDHSASNASANSRNSRLFYSSHADDDDSDEDSFESRHQHSANSAKSGNSKRSGDGAESASRLSLQDTDETKLIWRYRGFSTSIKSLFLDEPLVCASMGCFGLLLSNRTEYLLQIRNERRGTLSPRGSSRSNDRRKRLPSRVVAYGLLITVLLMFSTFIIWGFGTGNGLAGAYYGYDLYDENDQEQQQYWDDYLRGEGDDGNAAAADDEVAAANDDANQDKADDGANDDGNNADDGGANNDDAANDDAEADNDDAAEAAGGDDYYADDDGRRLQQHTIKLRPGNYARTRMPYRATGIFKLRDYQQGLWHPFYQTLQDEWNAELLAEQEASAAALHSRPRRRRRNEEEAADQDDAAVNDDANAATDDAAAADAANDDKAARKDKMRRTKDDRDLAGNIRIALLFAFLLFLGVLGRRRRMRTRFYLVRARAQEDHLFYASSKVGDSRRIAFADAREDQYEGACSHTLCGCYPVDEVAHPGDLDDAVEVTDAGIFRRKRKPHHEDIMARGFNCFMESCCGFMCKCWFQCLSVCALAQEAREIRLLVPPRYQRVDYITHQPFHEYQKEVNDLRRGWLGKTRRKAGMMPHFSALSRLSRYIVLLFLLSFSAIVATLLFNPRAAFSWQDAVVLAATFLQSFLVLFVVHWIFHKSDLSLDAVIKMFAAGFLIAVPSAFVFEGLLVNSVLLGAWSVYEMLAAIGGDGFVNFVFEHWRVIWIFGELFNAYVVAAITEELCKYYTFRAVEHPDLVFLTGLTRNEQDEDAVDGGVVKYPFASHQVQNLNRENSVDTASHHSHRSNRKSRRKRAGERLIERTGTRDDEFEEDELDARTYRQRAMAITTGMISVAVGLACAENFLYVFVLGGATGNSSSSDSADRHRGDVIEEWIVLFFRSVFPIHALAAALQSINMIRKFVETDNQNGHRIGVGRIITPAVLVHGSFDAVLMGINVFVETAWDRYLEANEGNVGDDEPYNALMVNIVAWISITVIMLAGILWYYRENRNQRLRLILLEEKEKVRLAEGGTGAAPWSAHPTAENGATMMQKEVELV